MKFNFLNLPSSVDTVVSVSLRCSGSSVDEVWFLEFVSSVESVVSVSYSYLALQKMTFDILNLLKSSVDSMMSVPYRCSGSSADEVWLFESTIFGR